MNAHDKNRLKKLLQQALPPVNSDAGPARDLWPYVLRRIDARTTAPALNRWAWFDGALLAGLVVLVAIFPAAIPVFLYYL
jgi:hypothetical protein